MTALVPARAMFGKADTPATRVRTLEARTIDGRYASAASHANAATVLRVRERSPRQRSNKALVVSHGSRTATGTSMGKAMPMPFGAAALIRAGQAGARVVDSTPGLAVTSTARRAAASPTGKFLGRNKTAVAAIGAGTAGVGGGLVLRRRNATMQKGLGGTTGRGGDGVVLGRWDKPNSLMPDGARHGRRLPVN